MAQTTKRRRGCSQRRYHLSQLAHQLEWRALGTVAVTVVVAHRRDRGSCQEPTLGSRTPADGTVVDLDDDFGTVLAWNMPLAP